MKNLSLIVLLLTLTIGCKNEQPAAKAPTASKSTTGNTLPVFPMAELKNLFNNATYVDYIFHKLPFAVSQDSKEGVKGNIVMVSATAPKNYSSSCPSLGREFFHIDGEIVWEAEVYFDKDSGCAAYIFYRDKKPVYISDITDNGKTFYLNLLNQSFR